VLVPVDPALVDDEVEHVLADSGAALLLDGTEACDELAAEGPDREPEPAVDVDDPLLIMYTSGTTGRPKGVVLTHGNVLFTSFNQILGWGLGATDRALVAAPLHHVGGLLVLGFPCVHVGGSAYLAPLEPDAVLEAVGRERITALFLPPRVWVRLAEHDGLDGADLSSVRLCATGGEPLPVELLERLIGAFGAEFSDAYGLTEAASCSTLLRGHDALRKAGSAGKALVHNLVRIVGADGGGVDPGEVGEIVQAGPTVMKEYWRRPAETSDALRDGWLHTGDLGYTDEEGFLYVAGRSKDVIVSGGAKIYPAEVERVLREHDAVADVAVIGVADEQLGEAVVAVVVPRPGTALAPAEVLDFCRGRIAEYKRPHVAFVRDSLPRNTNGKIVKAELRRIYGARS
jgi:fatty-acyl-CoA synthase